MPTSCRRVLAGVIVSAFAALVGLAPARAQFGSVHTPDRPTRESETNFFASWAGGERIHGVAIDLPGGWSLLSAEILRDGYVPVVSRVRRLSNNRYVVLGAEEIRGPHELVFRVRIGDSPGTELVSFTPVLNSGGRLISREGLRVDRTLRASERITDPENFVYGFEGSQPLLLRKSRVPDLTLRKDFSVALWFKTTRPGEVLLSTWDGDDKQSYPIELVIDAAGKIRCFRGRPGQHQSLASKIPVADGNWHRVTVTNSADEGWMRLAVDDRTVDSLYSPVPLTLSTRLPLAIGGRVPGRDTYFDGLRAYTAFVDDVRISSEGRGELRLGFEERIPASLLHGQVRGVRRERSDLVFRQPVRDLRAAAGVAGIVLSWHAVDPQLEEFVVERSSDGNTFAPAIRVPAETSGDGRYSVTDPAAGSGVTYYRVRQKYRGSGERLSATIKVGLAAEQPESVVLIGNFPNPFNATTTLAYEVRANEHIRLSIWDLAGQQVATLVNRAQGPGTYEVQFSAVDLPSGTYFARLESRSGMRSHKMILMK